MADLGRCAAMDAVLRRVAAHPDAARVVVRGGVVSRRWVGPHVRPAEDVDLLAEMPLTHGDLAGFLGELAAIHPGDGLRVEAGPARVIWPDTAFPGWRAVLTVDGLPVQVDLGFGDPIDPPPEWTDVGFEAPIVLRAVRPETGIAWKAHGLFEQPGGRWRAKDLHDLDAFLAYATYDEDALTQALKLAFESRAAPLSVLDRLFEGDFGTSPKARAEWETLRESRPGMPLDSIPEVVARVAARLGPVVDAIEGEIPAMHGRFPDIVGIGPVLAAVGATRGVVVHERGGVRVVNAERKPPMPDPDAARLPRTRYHRAILRECRGLAFEGERPIARPYHACFHVDSPDETQVARLAPIVARERPHALEKLDGAMILAARHDGRLRFFSRRGPSPIGEEVGAFVADRPAIADLCERWIARGYTPIFEWCARSCRVVIDHPVSRLVLTALRHTRSGEYVPYERMREEEGVEIVGTRGRVTDLAALVAEVRAEPEGEGVVLRFDDGRMVKIKTDRYRRLHRAVEAQDPTRARWEVILHGELDRLRPLVEDADSLAERIEAGIAREAAIVAPLLEAWRATEGLARRERIAAGEALFAGVHHLAARCVRSAREGESAEEVVRRVALEMGAGEGVRRWLE